MTGSSNTPSHFVRYRERIIGTVPLAYDADHTMRYGYWTHDCGAHFFPGGGHHKNGCTSKGAEDCTYHFGPQEVEMAKQWAQDHDEDAKTPLGVVTLGILKVKFPHLVQ